MSVALSASIIAVGGGLGIIAQLVLSAVFDHHGFLGSVQHSFDLRRLIGMLVLFAGTWLIVR